MLSGLWTLDDCQAKWGAPIKVEYSPKLDSTHYIFKAGPNLQVQVDLLQGQVHSEIYWSKNKSLLSTHESELLQKNAAGNWILYDDGRGRQTFATWHLLDQKRRADLLRDVSSKGRMVRVAGFKRLLQQVLER
jgi:hypothetical protein